MSKVPLSIAILGPGGVGGLVGAVMARAGSAVEILAGDDTARVIARSGIHVDSVRFGRFTMSAHAYSRMTRPVDVCLIAVKATQLEQAMDRVPPYVLGRGLLVPLLNGIDHVALLRERYPATSVVPATIRIESTRIRPGAIRQTSPFAAIAIADSREHHGRLEHMVAELKTAGFDAQLCADETAMLWNKLAFLVPLALLTTHARTTAGVIRTEYRPDMLAVIAEVAAVAEAEGAKIDESAVVALLDSVPETMESSMQRDEIVGGPLELEAIGGAVIRHGKSSRIPVPVTKRLVDEIRVRILSARRGLTGPH